MKILVNFCIGEVDRKGVRKQEGRHTVSKFRGAVTMTIIVETRSYVTGEV